MFANGASLTNLTLNPSKSNYHVIPRKQNIRSHHFTLFINDLSILLCDKTKYLGFFIGSPLNFNSLIKSVENKVARSVGTLKIGTIFYFYFSSQIILFFYSISFVE